MFHFNLLTAVPSRAGFVDRQTEIVAIVLLVLKSAGYFIKDGGLSKH